MRARTDEKITGDCINAVFQGFFDRQTLEEEQALDGLGIVIDDEFNFIMSHWRNSMINGDTFIRTSCGNMVYGAFEQSSPVGMVAVLREGLKIYLNRINLKNRIIQLQKQAAVFDYTHNIFYLVELSKRDDQETTMDQKASLSETSRYDKVKLQWKVKIVERCPLKIDGTPAFQSKTINRYDTHIEYSKADFTSKEQHQIHLLSSSLGSAFQKASFIAPRTYLKDIAKHNINIALNRFKQSNQQEQMLYLTLANARGRKNSDKHLGLKISLSYEYTKCLGTFNKEGHLNGLGVQYRKNGQSFVGIFKDNILAKQYKFNNGSSKNVSTFPIRQLLMQEHMKSLNYIHNCIYLPQISNLSGLASKIAKYIEYFEKEFEKRNTNYNDTPSNQSVASQIMNIYKYVDLNRQNHPSSQPANNQMISNAEEREFKKPGFIRKSNTKSVEKSPQQSKQSYSPHQSKSPLRNVRIAGKIYQQSGRPAKQLSYSRQYAHLKLNQATYRRDTQL